MLPLFCPEAPLARGAAQAAVGVARGGGDSSLDSRRWWRSASSFCPQRVSDLNRGVGRRNAPSCRLSFALPSPRTLTARPPRTAALPGRRDASNEALAPAEPPSPVEETGHAHEHPARLVVAAETAGAGRERRSLRRGRGRRARARGVPGGKVLQAGAVHVPRPRGRRAAGQDSQGHRGAAGAEPAGRP